MIQTDPLNNNDSANSQDQPVTQVPEGQVSIPASPNATAIDPQGQATQGANTGVPEQPQTISEQIAFATGGKFKTIEELVSAAQQTPAPQKSTAHPVAEIVDNLLQSGKGIPDVLAALQIQAIDVTNTPEIDLIATKRSMELGLPKDLVRQALMEEFGIEDESNLSSLPSLKQVQLKTESKAAADYIRQKQVDLSKNPSQENMQATIEAHNRIVDTFSGLVAQTPLAIDLPAQVGDMDLGFTFKPTTEQLQRVNDATMAALKNAPGSYSLDQQSYGQFMELRKNLATALLMPDIIKALAHHVHSKTMEAAIAKTSGIAPSPVQQGEAPTAKSPYAGRLPNPFS